MQIFKLLHPLSQLFSRFISRAFCWQQQGKLNSNISLFYLSFNYGGWRISTVWGRSSQINVFCFWLMFAKSCCHLGDWTVGDRRTDDCLWSSAQVEPSPRVGERIESEERRGTSLSSATTTKYEALGTWVKKNKIFCFEKGKRTLALKLAKDILNSQIERQNFGI